MRIAGDFFMRDHQERRVGPPLLHASEGIKTNSSLCRLSRSARVCLQLVHRFCGGRQNGGALFSIRFCSRAPPACRVFTRFDDEEEESPVHPFQANHHVWGTDGWVYR